jgi:hypothetical protein
MTDTNAFIGKTKKPTPAEITKALGPAKSLWDQLLAELADQFELTDQEWTSYSPKHGWSLRMKRKKRNILYFVPCQCCFQIVFILGDKAIKATREIKLSKPFVKIIDEGKRYPEGTLIRFIVKKPKDIDFILKLTAVKLAN